MKRLFKLSVLALTVLPFGYIAFFIMNMGYVAHALVSKKSQGTSKLLWAIRLFVGGILVMPIYWFVKVWPEAPMLEPSESLAF